jgi:hypothetical protein
MKTIITEANKNKIMENNTMQHPNNKNSQKREDSNEKDKNPMENKPKPNPNDTKPNDHKEPTPNALNMDKTKANWEDDSDDEQMNEGNSGSRGYQMKRGERTLVNDSSRTQPINIMKEGIDGNATEAGFKAMYQMKFTTPETNKMNIISQDTDNNQDSDTISWTRQEKEMIASWERDESFKGNPIKFHHLTTEEQDKILTERKNISKIVEKMRKKKYELGMPNYFHEKHPAPTPSPYGKPIPTSLPEAKTLEEAWQIPKKRATSSTPTRKVVRTTQIKDDNPFLPIAPQENTGKEEYSADNMEIENDASPQKMKPNGNTPIRGKRMNSAQLREALQATHEEFNEMADNFDAIMAEAKRYNEEQRNKLDDVDEDEPTTENKSQAKKENDTMPTTNHPKDYDTQEDETMTETNDKDNHHNENHQSRPQSSLQKAVQEEKHKQAQQQPSHTSTPEAPTTKSNNTKTKRIQGEYRTNLHMEFMQVEFKKIKDRTTLRQTTLGLMIAMLTVDNKLKFYDAYGDPVTLKDIEEISEEDYDKRFETNEAINRRPRKDEAKIKYNNAIQVQTYQELRRLKFLNEGENPYMHYLREHHIHTKTVGLITSNWYYRVGGWYGYKVQFLHNATIKQFIVNSIFEVISKSLLQEIEDALKNEGDLSEEVRLNQENFDLIFELQPETFSIGEGKENHTSAKVMEISCPGCILQQFRNLCLTSLPTDNETDPGKSLGYFAPSNIGTIMDTQAEGQEAIKLQLRRHNRETENQQNIPLFYIPDLTLQVLDDSRNPVTLRDRLLQISQGLTIFANDTDIPGHYKLIVKTDKQDASLKTTRDKIDEYLQKLYEPRPQLYHTEWGLPTAYRYKSNRIEIPQEADAITIYRQKMKNQVKNTRPKKPK